jgi:hypothetical protein
MLTKVTRRIPLPVQGLLTVHGFSGVTVSKWRVWRYLGVIIIRITQWPKEKLQKDKQRSSKHTYKTKDRVTRTPIKTGCELMCTGRVSSSCSTSDTRRVNIVMNLSHEWGKDREVFETSGTYSWSFVIHIFFVIFRLVIVLSVGRYTTSDYPLVSSIFWNNIIVYWKQILP